MNLQNSEELQVTIYKTKDYGQFVKHNLQPEKRKRADRVLTDSIRETDGNSLQPILVTVDGRILDGHRRKESCSLTKTWLYFMIVSDVDEKKFMKEINITSSNWSTTQIISSQATYDEDYATMYEFIKEKGASVELLNLFSPFSYSQIRAGIAHGINYKKMNEIKETANFIAGVFGVNSTLVLRAVKKLSRDVKTLDLAKLKTKVERDKLNDKYINIMFGSNVEKIRKILTKTYKTK